MKILGRIIVRSGNTAGLFIPFTGADLKPGIYQLSEVMDEMTVTYLGESQLQKRDRELKMRRFDGLDIAGLHSDIAIAGMTPAEYDRIT